MPRIGDRSDATDVLLRTLDEGRTGALLGLTPTGERCTAYVMNGEVLAVQAEDDDHALLRRLLNAGFLPPDRAREIERDVASGAPATSILFDLVPEEVMATALYERFREDLYRFLGGAGVPAFEPLDTVFVDNIQVSHDSRALVAELRDLRVANAPLEDDPARRVQPGAGTITGEDQMRMVELCANGLPLLDLLHRSPLEPNRTLALVARMVDAGALTIDGPTPRRASSPPVPLAPDPSPEPTGRWMVAREEVDTLTPEGEYLPDGDIEEHTEEVDRSTFRQSPPVSPAQLLAPAGADEDELAAFADHDYVRGDGSFVQSRWNLDRVVLADDEPRPRTPPRDAVETLVVEMEEADAGDVAANRHVSLNFAGRKLVDGDARKKIEVVNEVLATVVEALDDAKGGGVGLARIQVLLEGTSGAHAVLFSQVELLPGGRLPVDRVMRNLKKRPEGERRHLLNRALADVIERTLSLADEALDQRGMERMLEQIAGYQQRMGV